MPKTTYLGVTNTLALLRLLPMSDRVRDMEILALRHQITVLERHLYGEKIRFTWADRAFLAALLHRLPRDVLRDIRLLVRPETVLRWHRDLIAYRHARISRPTRVGRPPTIRSIRRQHVGVPHRKDLAGNRSMPARSRADVPPTLKCAVGYQSRISAAARSRL